MKNKTIYRFTSIEEIHIKLPIENREEWFTEIICTEIFGSRIKLLLSSVDRYANIWALTHDFEEMELVDLFEGTTKYEFGRFLLSIKSDGYVHEQWFKDASVTKL